MSNRSEFRADTLEVVDEDHGAGCKVVGIHVGHGDPEGSGEHWNFTRSIPDDEHESLHGVCTVKEIQQITHYGGIRRFSVSRASLDCIFDDATVAAIGYDSIHVDLTGVDVDLARLYLIARETFNGTEALELANDLEQH